MNKVFIINNELIGNRLDKVVSLLDDTISRTKAIDLIKDNKIIVNNKFEKASYKVKLNDEIKINNEIEEINLLEKEDIDLNIVYEDDHVIVINKPSGMVVHPANGHHNGTLVNALLYHFDSLSTLAGETRPGIVHRLDKETSGLIMVAKTDIAHKSLSEQLKDKTAYRQYKALISGEFPHTNAMIKAPIGRSKIDRKKMMVIEGGKDAGTIVSVVERFSGFTLVDCVLKTGRTHQIRVHLSTIKYPIVGDIIYGPKKPLYDNMLLHAETLSFIHPISGQRITLSCPLPNYFKEALDNLRNFGTLKKEN